MYTYINTTEKLKEFIYKEFNSKSMDSENIIINLHILLNKFNVKSKIKQGWKKDNTISYKKAIIYLIVTIDSINYYIYTEDNLSMLSVSVTKQEFICQ